MLSDAEKLISKSFVSELLERIDGRWSAEAWAGLTSADDAFSALDKEIRAARASSRDISELLEGALRDTKTKFDQVISRVASHRNRLPSINRLPLEVLRNIFQSVSSCGLHHIQNVIIMSVCTYWRSVVLHDAKMWTVVDFTRVGRRYATMAVERSYPLPLDMLGWNSQQWVRDIIAANLGRAERLELDLAPDETKHKACFEGAQAPILAQLRLRGPGDHESDGWDFRPILPTHSPRLHSLDLLNCPFPRNIGIHTSLTILKIEIEDLDTQIISYFPDGDIAAVVRECPQLEHLTVIFAHQRTGDMAPVIAEETEMRSLRVLVLALPEQYLVYLMKCMVLPSIDTLHLTARRCAEPNIVAALFRPHRISDTLFSAISVVATSMTGNTCAIEGFTLKPTVLKLKVELQVVEETLQDSSVEHPFKLLLSTIRENYTLPKLQGVRFEGNRDVMGFHDRQWPGYTREMTLFMIHNPTIRVIIFKIRSKRRYTTCLDEVRAALSDVVASSGVWPLPNLLNCSFVSHGSGSNCEPCTTGILQFLKFVTSHKPLRTSHICCGTVVVAERRSAVDFIRGVRALHIRSVWWTGTYFEINEVPRCMAAAVDLWPRRAKYNWQCGHDTAHLAGTKSVVNCCRGNNPRTAHDYFDNTRKVASMYRIARDWAALLDAELDRDGTIARSDI